MPANATPASNLPWGRRRRMVFAAAIREPRNRQTRTWRNQKMSINRIATSIAVTLLAVSVAEAQAQQQQPQQKPQQTQQQPPKPTGTSGATTVTAGEIAKHP